MPVLLERDQFSGLRVEADERLARNELRRQIGRLERELAGLLGEAFGRVELAYRVEAPAGAGRVLGLGELEQLRDRLSDRVAEAQPAPADFKWVRVSRHDVGEPGCGGWHSRPRLGPIGMLMGWWRVKVSSGCPLAGRLAAVELEAQGEEEEAAGGEPARSGGSLGGRGRSGDEGGCNGNAEAGAPGRQFRRAPARALGQLPAGRAGDLRRDRLPRRRFRRPT
jgi:hypothetical protein